MVCREDYRTAEFAFYRYEPSVAAAVIFCLLFLASGLLHFFQMWRTKTWYLTCLVVGCFRKLPLNASIFVASALLTFWAQLSSLVMPDEQHLRRKK